MPWSAVAKTCLLSIVSHRFTNFVPVHALRESDIRSVRRSASALSYMPMKTIVLILLIVPAISYAECKINPDEIKPKVKGILAPLHNSFNLLITEDEFKLAHKEISELLDLINYCHIELEARVSKEYKNTDIANRMKTYWLYSSELKSIEMQLRSGYESFDLGVLRPIGFEIGKWESVANEFYEKEI